MGGRPLGSESDMADFISAEQDRIISFLTDPDGTVSFHILQKFQPLEFEGLQPVYWRKIFRSPAFPGKDAAFAAARAQFAWVEAAWRADL